MATKKKAKSKAKKALAKKKATKKAPVKRAPVATVGLKDDFGMKVRDHVRENDVVYKIA